MRSLILAAAAILAVAGGGVLLTVDAWRSPATLPATGYYLQVGAGESLAAVSRRLERDGVIPRALSLNTYGRYTGLDAQIQRGEYLLLPPLTLSGILQKLVEGTVIEYQITLPEGITLRRALATLAGESKLETVIDGDRDPRLLALADDHESAEGLFLPETYRYRKGDTDWDILSRAHSALDAALAASWADRASGLPLEKPYDALILASIIERETGLPEERERISGVFIRRLERGMRLQTDPTVIYGLGPGFDGDLRRRDLLDSDNPYNTYRHHGLPPTPIALAGLAAIRAALQPAAGNEIYFVARGDGSHQFSATLEAHERAVREHQLQRRADYRSTPAPEAL